MAAAYRGDFSSFTLDGLLRRKLACPPAMPFHFNFAVRFNDGCHVRQICTAHAQSRSQASGFGIELCHRPSALASDLIQAEAGARPGESVAPRVYRERRSHRTFGPPPLAGYRPKPVPTGITHAPQPPGLASAVGSGKLSSASNSSGVSMICSRCSRVRSPFAISRRSCALNVASVGVSLRVLSFIKTVYSSAVGTSGSHSNHATAVPRSATVVETGSNSPLDRRT